MDMRTPLGKVRGLGSAKSGTEHFWHQRLTAIANVPLVLFLIWFVIAHLSSSRAELKASIANPFIALLLALSMVSILWHMKLGMQVIIEDYVHTPFRRTALLILNGFFCVALGAAALLAIANLSFGS